MKPLKSKTGLDVANALEKIFKERKPDKLWVDFGSEFYNKEVQKLVTLYSMENDEKSSVGERWNRTMKDKMFKYFCANSTRRYIDVLDEFVEQYNYTKHSSIGMYPKEASKKENETKVYSNLYGNYDPPDRKTPKFSIGDNVRINVKIIHLFDRTTTMIMPDATATETSRINRWTKINI